MRNYFYLFAILFLVSGCGLLPVGQATPTPDVADVALERFLAGAPVAVRAVATPSPTAMVDAFWLRPGLPLPLVEPLDVVGDITIAGSPALAPQTRALYEDFVRAGYRNMIQIQEISSDNAFQLYCTQAHTARESIDIVMADRTMQQTELQLCLQNNRRPIALRVGFDAVVIVAHAETQFLTSVSKAELATLFTARRWSDVRQEWPHDEIIHVALNSSSLTARLFIDKILDKDEALLRNAPAITFLEDSAEVNMMVADTPNAVGFLPFSDYRRNPTGLKLVALDGLIADEYTISSGAYALINTLLLYTDLETLTARVQVKAFLMYYLAHMNGLPLERSASFPLSEAAYERTKIILLTALGQERYIAQFAPTSTPTPGPTLTLTVTPTIAVTSVSTTATPLPSTMTSLTTTMPISVTETE